MAITASGLFVVTWLDALDELAERHVFVGVRQPTRHVVHERRNDNENHPENDVLQR